MKRFISILLAAMLVVAMVPASFAAEKNLTVKQSVFEYSFTTAAYGMTTSPANAADQIALLDKETDSNISDQWNLILRYGVNWMQVANASGSYINFTVKEVNKKKDACVVAIKLNVASAGTFIPEITYLGVPSGYIHDIYLVKSDETIKPTTIESVGERNAVFALIDDGDFLGTVDMYEATSTVKTVSLNPVTIAEGEEGDYILVFRSNGYNEKYDPYVPDGRTDKFMHGYIRGFKLTADFNAAAVENGTLNYNFGMSAMNGDQMFTPGSDKTVDVTGDNVADSYSSFPYLRCTSRLGTVGSLYHVASMNWWATTPYGASTTDVPTKLDPPIQVMNLANTDPWAIDYYDTYSTRVAMYASADCMYFNLRMGTTTNPNAYAGINADGSASGSAGYFNYFVLYRVIIPYAGEYDLKFTPSSAAKSWGPVPAVYFFPVKGTNITSVSAVRARINAASASEKIGYVNFSSNAIDGTLDKVPARVSAPHAGEYYIVLRPDATSATYNAATSVSGNYTYQDAYFEGITLEPIAKTDDYMTDIDISISDKALTAGEKSTASVTADYFKGATSALAEGVAYKSSAESVATVDASGNITALRQGTALISAMTEDGMVSSEFVTVADVEERKSVSLAVANSVNKNIDVTSGERGNEVTVTAEDIDGYTFRHWVRGTADKGTWLSADKSYTFSLMTNSYLTAVYSENTTDKIVEFFNENGEYYAEAKVDANGNIELPAEPSRTGFKFLKWLLSETEELTESTVLTSAVTRAVARYTDTGDTFSVENPVDTSTETKNYSYDDKITASSSYVYTDNNGSKTLTPYVYWYRNGKQVDYGTEYTYYVWDKAEITKSFTGTNAPLVVLDSVVKKDNAYMIEYDAAGKQIIEVGILFGRAGTTPTVESCDGKATSQKTEEHGQFTAKIDDSTAVARGYLIYNDGGTYRVIYSD